MRALSFAECPLAGSACRVQEQDLWVKVFVTVMQPRVIGKEGTSMEEMTLSYWPVGQSVGHFLNDGYKRAQPTLGGISPGQLLLGCLKIQAEQTMGSKTVNRILL